ncbi:MAG TPA: branched-chain-amino-acid transaminase [Polyangiaceae bacterium]|jgi:branched-chain amino acid aminotransferase|nr:branched-chain-amino-acid transaminase [Polyangiaceae bacterium]
MGFPAIWMNGQLTEPDDARVSVFDHGLLYGDGVFEGIRFYSGRAFRLEAHLERLERSAAAIALELPHSCAALKAAVDAVIERSGAGDGYIRLIVTRGAGALGLDPRSCEAPTTIVVAAPLRVFEQAERGVAVIVASTRQAAADVVDARIKSLNYMNRLMAKLEAIRAGADEAFMLNAQGHLAEGTTDNVFLVRDGVLLTPPASDGALEGITRHLVLDLAKTLGIPAREASLGTYDLRTADEAFLVGTAAEMVAIRSIDGRPVASCPGAVFRRIAPAFEELVRRESAGEIS